MGSIFLKVYKPFQILALLRGLLSVRLLPLGGVTKNSLLLRYRKKENLGEIARGNPPLYEQRSRVNDIPLIGMVRSESCGYFDSRVSEIGW